MELRLKAELELKYQKLQLKLSGKYSKDILKKEA